MYNPYTENLAEIINDNLEVFYQTIRSWVHDGLPVGFADDNVRPAYNRNSGLLFLVNDDFQVAMLNEDKLEIFYTLPYSGDENFLEDFISDYTPSEMNSEDVQYIRDIAEVAGVLLPSEWIIVE